MDKKNLIIEKKYFILLGLLRFFLGFIFLWAFLDKMFGLGFSTLRENSWIAGGSPTLGYLESLNGTFSYFFNQISGLFAVDFLFMLGLLVIGICLTFGIFNKIGNLTGFLFTILLYFSALPIKQNPFIDSHFIYIWLFVSFYFIDTTDYFGIEKLKRVMKW